MTRNTLKHIGWIATLGLLLSGPAAAHGDQKPSHGGQLVEASHVSMELVAQASKVQVFLTEHGKSVAASGSSGSVILLADGKKTEVQLKAMDANRLEGQSSEPIRLPAKAIVKLSLPGGKTDQARFELAK